MFRIGDNHTIGIQHHDITGFPHLDFGNHIRNHWQVNIESQNAQRLVIQTFDRSKNTYSRRAFGGLERLSYANLAYISHALLEPVTAAGVIPLLTFNGRILQITAIRGTIADNRYTALIRFTKALEQLIRSQFKAAFSLRVHSNHAIGTSCRNHSLIRITGNFPASPQNRVIGHIDQAIPQTIEE